VLHRHDAVDEGFFVVAGVVEFQLGDDRLVAAAGDFAWVPRGTAHTFASASANPVPVVGFATPGGIEHLFAGQFEYLSSLDDPPDPAVMDEMGLRHGAPTLGPPIIATNAPVLP
jgi:Cupin domain